MASHEIGGHGEQVRDAWRGNVADLLPIDVVEADRSGGASSTNRWWTSLTGLASADSTGSGWFDVRPLENSAMRLATLQTAPPPAEIDVTVPPSIRRDLRGAAEATRLVRALVPPALLPRLFQPLLAADPRAGPGPLATGWVWPSRGRSPTRPGAA